MKTERRQELQKNDLADWLASQTGNIEPLAKILIGVLLLLMAIYFISTTMSRRGKESAARSWDQFRYAASEQDIDGLREIADLYPGTEAAGWGSQTAGDISLATGSMAMYGNREKASERLKDAKDDFEIALKISETVDTPLLKQRALLGLAQANEALNEFDAAGECYEQVISDWPDAAIANDARARLAFLRDPSTQQFYDWFMKQELELPPPIRPIGGGDIKPPSVYGDLPGGNTGLTLPGINDLDGSDAGDELTPPEAGTEDSSEAPAAEAPVAE